MNLPVARSITTKRAMWGATLVEVMVALVVMSTGMLGIALLQVDGIRAARSSTNFLLAVQLASDMAERIGANRTMAPHYSGPARQHACGGGQQVCTPDELAADDLFHWYNDIGRLLPNGAAGHVIPSPESAGTRYRIRLQWPDGGFATPLVYSISVFVATMTTA